MAVLGELILGEDVLSESSTPDISQGRVAWSFHDFSGGQEYFWPINPLEVKTPGVTKTISSKPTCAGQLVKYEGRSKPGVLSFSGTIMSENQRLVMEAWFHTKKQIRITDDLGQQWWVYLTNFTPTRKYNKEYPWMLEYNATATTLNWGNQ